MSPARPTPIDRRPAAFTLVELLVVIGIISVLISILLPALVNVRNQAKTVVCKSNMQQFAVALRMYSNDNEDKYPDPETVLGKHGFRRGAGLIGDTNPMDYPSFVPSSLPETYGLPAKFAEYGYIREPKVWVCPSSTDWMREVGNSYTVTTGGTWNNPVTLKTWKIEEMTSKVRGATINVKPVPGFPKALGLQYITDNFSLYPAKTGEIRSGSPSWLIPVAARPGYFSHIISKRTAVNILYVDGHVGFALYLPHPPGQIQVQ